MCGIAGFFLKQPLSDPVQTLSQMADSQAHRGPDAAETFLSEDRRLGLAHRRLSILDTSHAADQPMHSQNGQHVICYNGEVYNFRELSKRINAPLKTTGDTEVLLEGIAQHGPEFMNDTHGMFAIAQYDQQKCELLLMRDRIGIKPLYIAERQEGLYFASELKALRAVLPELKINPDAIELYLQVGFIPHPHTIYEGIQVFPTGHQATYSPEKGLRLKSYWQLPERVPKQPRRFDSEQALLDQLDELVQAAVKRRLIADVPLGAFLSGGIDSSLVTAIAQQHSTHALQTFSIGFEDKKFNELHYAEAVAHHLKTDQHSFLLKEAQALEQIDKILDVYDQPYASGSAIPTLLVSEMARQHVTVALSGDGGDESFLGYGAYLWAQRLNQPLVELIRKPMSSLLKMSGVQRFRGRADLVNYPSHERMHMHLLSQDNGHFSSVETAKLLERSLKADALVADGYPDWVHAAGRHGLFDFKFLLPDDLLVKVDRASMHHSLEVRVPLLDHAIVEFAHSLPDDVRIQRGELKYLLKQLLRRYLPDKIIDRPKWGFGSPLHRWLSGELSHLLDKYLSNAAVEQAGVLSPKVVGKHRDRLQSGDTSEYRKIWDLIVLQRWLIEKQ